MLGRIATPRLPGLLRNAALALGVAAVLAVVAGVGLAELGPGSGQPEPDKAGVFDETGLSDAERQSRIDALRSQNVDWLRQFVEQGRDPRSLPVESGETYSPGVTSLEEAREKSRQAIEGRVVATTYELSPDSHRATSIATVDVIRSSPGTQVAQQIEAVQIGGPARTEDGIGVLQQLAADPLLLPGDHVVLLLVPACAVEHNAQGRYQTVFGAGTFYVTPDGLRAPHRGGLEGSIENLSAADLLSMFEQDPSRSDNPLCEGL